MANANANNQYGPTLKTGEAVEMAMNIFEKSRTEKEAGRKGIPICSWGEAGIGKTETPNHLVDAYAEFFGGISEEVVGADGVVVKTTIKKGNIVYLPMAQIEEKAELQGLPDLKEIVKEISKEDYESGNYIGIGSEKIITNEKGKKETVYLSVDNRTIYATPSYIPQEATHGKYGLLVIDDMNRADGRIINSIMQLLQDGELLGWSLPQGWEIYCTCNPDDGKYDVTPLDGAQMTRMSNFFQTWDVKTWTRDWANKTGIHPIAINFANANKEMMVKGERTNPRSFDKFFREIYELLDQVKVTSESEILNASEGEISISTKIQKYGLMNIEAESLTSFISFITSNLGKLPDMEEIATASFDLKGFFSNFSQQGIIRVDVVSILSNRLVYFLEEKGSELTKDQIAGIKNWVMWDKLPGDLRWLVTNNLAKHCSKAIDKELSQVIVKSFVKKKRK